MNRSTHVLVAYYSSTGSVYRLAEAVVAGVEKAGAEVRLRRVPELAPAPTIAANPAWAEHVAETGHISEVSLDDLRWADGVVLGTPTRFGLPSSQMKQFIDRTGGMWFRNELQNKVYASFTATSTQHGGAEATILALNNTFYHWGGIIVPPGYTADIQHRHGNPYGSSHVATDAAMPGDVSLLSAQHMGERVAWVAAHTSALRAAEVPRSRPTRRAQ
jgi:NAD(P)H dehydrogenase (quinone)